MAINTPLTAAKVDDSQNWMKLEFHFAAAAAGTAWSLITAQQGCATKCRAIQGNASADLLTAAQAQAMVKNDSGVISTEAQAIADDLVTYFTDVPAAADAAKAIAFCVGGLSGSDVLAARISWTSVGTAAANNSMWLRNSARPVVATSSTAVVYGTDTLVVYPSVGVVAGSFTLFDVLDVPAANAPVILELWIKP